MDVRAGSGVDGLRGTERLLEGLYQRHGERYLAIWPATSALVLVVVIGVTVWSMERHLALSGDELLGVFAITLGGAALAAAWPRARWYREGAAPIARWLRCGRPPGDAEAVWQAAARFPRDFTLGVGGRCVLLSALPACAYTTWALDGGAAQFAYLAPASMFPVVFGSAWFFLLAEIEVRPVLRDVQRHLPQDPADAGRQVPLAAKIVAGVVPIEAAAALLALSIYDPGGGPQAAFEHVAISIGLALTLPFVVLVVLADVILTPVRRLAEGTTRVADGDLSAHVPLLSTDELGVLTRRFNAMVDDLRRSRQGLVSAREEERRRLRRDLHDGLGPSLAAVALRLDAARNLLATDRDAADELLASARQETQAAVADIRGLVNELRPPALDERGLVDAVRERAEALMPADPASPRIEVEVTEALPALPAAVEVAAYRIATEALTNVVRHSGAERCRLRIALDADALVVDVEDDGRGLAEGRPAGVGLVSMRERATELGGTCHFATREEGGTRVRARLPLRIA